MSRTEPESDPFFVGWLRMPGDYARFLLRVAQYLVIGSGLAAVLIAYEQRSPGTGSWEDGTTTFVGIADAEPYAMIRVPPTEPGGVPRTVLLVEEGKFGAKDRVRPHNAQPVRVSGTLLSRGDRLMLELASGEEGLRSATLSESEQALLRRSPRRSRGPVSLRGEIVDSKCYLGAMKPGGGLTHKGCGVLCLKGGIPPLFVSGEGAERLYLLTDMDGGQLDSRYFECVGDSIQLDGVLEEWGDLHLLKVMRFSR